VGGEDGEAEDRAEDDVLDGEGAPADHGGHVEIAFSAPVMDAAE
jgi:hypothetical protein